MAKIDRRSLVTQVRDSIWEMVQEGNYGPGDQLPSEEELVNQFVVSRATVRESLRILEEERHIICRHGVGRFVASSPSGILNESITNLNSVTEMAKNLAIPVTTRLLSLREELPDEAIRTHLHIDPGIAVVILERVRLAHNEPVIYSIDTFPRTIVVGELNEEEFTGSLLEIMEKRWNALLVYSKAIISAVELDLDLSQRIGVPDCMPWILLEQVNYDAQDHPVLYSKDYHRGDKFQFNVLRRRR